MDPTACFKLRKEHWLAIKCRMQHSVDRSDYMTMNKLA